MDWSGVDYCDVFIRCLDSHFDGTHSLQRIHWWASDVMLHFSKSDLMKKQTHLNHLDCLRMSTFQANFHFGWTIPLRKSLQCKCLLCVVNWLKIFFFSIAHLNTQLLPIKPLFILMPTCRFWWGQVNFKCTLFSVCQSSAPAEITLEEMQG